MKERVTMARIAREADVSAMTVSRALRDYPGLPLKTRRRIQRLAQKLGYRPDPAVSQLMARLRVSRKAESQVIAWVTSHAGRDQWREGSSNIALHAGASAQAARLGYRLEPFWARAPDMTERRLGDILLHRGIRGLLVASLPETLGQLDFDWKHFAAATCGFSLARPNLHRACSQQFHAVRIAWDEFHRLGYERIGIVLSPESDDRADGMWLAAFLSRQQRAPSPRHVPPLLQPTGDKAGFLHWFHQHRPDAIVSAPHIRDWLLEAGLRIPEDCAFAHLNIIGLEGAGVDHHMEEIGAAAVDLVIEQLNAHRYGLPAVPKIVMVECSWRDGPTAPPKRGGTPTAGRPTPDAPL